MQLEPTQIIMHIMAPKGVQMKIPTAQKFCLFYIIVFYMVKYRDYYTVQFVFKANIGVCT